MNTGKETGSYVQCQHCGHIYQIKESMLIDKLYVASVCPRCNEYGKGLNCGDKKEDIFIFYDPYLDERYFKY